MSVNWFEQAQGANENETWRETERLIAAAPRTLKPSHRLARLSVGKIRGIHEVGLSGLDVRHEPEPNNHAHSGVHGMPIESEPLALALAQALVALVVESWPCCSRDD
jgi:hypothetical protein